MLVWYGSVNQAVQDIEVILALLLSDITILRFRSSSRILKSVLRRWVILDHLYWNVIVESLYSFILTDTVYHFYSNSELKKMPSKTNNNNNLWPMRCSYGWHKTYLICDFNQPIATVTKGSWNHELIKFGGFLRSLNHYPTCCAAPEGFHSSSTCKAFSS